MPTILVNRVDISSAWFATWVAGCLEADEGPREGPHKSPREGTHKGSREGPNKGPRKWPNKGPRERSRAIGKGSTRDRGQKLMPRPRPLINVKSDPLMWGALGE